MTQEPVNEDNDLAGQPTESSDTAGISKTSVGDLSIELPPNYEVIELIAEGAFGYVLKARQKAPARTVAVKVMKQVASGMDEGQAEEELALQKKRFQREADAVASLKHPGIVPIYEFAAVGGRYYFAMEYVDGVRLDRYVRDHRLSLREKLDLFARLCDIVAEAHTHGVTHRDLKPANILIDKKGDPRVLDFGLAKMAAAETTDVSAQMTECGTVMGTFAYMSPEQAEGRTRETDARTDVYSLGIILYQILTGEMPYRVDLPNPVAIIRNICLVEPKRPSDLSSDLRGDLETIVMKAVEKTPQRRYATAGDLGRDIAHYLKNEPIEARPASFLYRAVKAAQRHKVKVAVAATVLVALGLAQFVFRQISYERRQASYYSAISLAQSKIDEAAPEQARELLAGCPMDLRNWEWGRLKYLCDLRSIALEGHKDRVKCVAFSPDGRHVASASCDETVKIWDAATGDLRRTLKGHTLWVTSLAYSPDGTKIVSGAGEKIKPGELCMWSAADGQLIKRFIGQISPVTAVAYSPDGKWVVSGGGRYDAPPQLILWDAASGRMLRPFRGHTDRIFSVAFDPEGKRIASGSRDKTIKIWDAAEGRELKTLTSHTGQVTSVAFGPKGKRLVSCGYDKKIRIWDVDQGKEERTLSGHSGEVWSVGFDPEGKRIVSAGHDGTVRVWDVAAGKMLMTFAGHSGAVYCASFGPEGERVVSAGYDKTARIWNLRAGRGLTVLKGHSDDVSSVVFGADGKTLASGSLDRTVRIWDVASGRELSVLRGHAGGVLSIDISPDGKRLVSGSGDGTGKVWDIGTAKELVVLKGHSGEVSAAAFSHDGRLVATGGADRRVRIWNADDGVELLVLEGHTQPVTCVAFARGGPWVVSGSRDSTVKAWDTNTGEELRTMRADSGICSISCTFDAAWLAAGTFDKLVKIWYAGTGQELWELVGHSARVSAVAFSPDLKRLVSGSYDNTVKIWVPYTAREVLTLKGHSDSVTSVAVSRDGRLIASGSRDGTAIIWKSADWR